MVLAEAVRGAWPFGGLPLAGIELGQAAGPLAPAARLGGRLLLVGLVALAGAGLATAVRRRRAGLVPAVAAAAVVMVVAGGGAVAPGGRFAGELTVAAVQGGGPRGLRAVETDSAPVLDAHLRAAATITPGVDLVLWPEDVVDVARAFAGSDEEAALSALANALRTTLVVGIVEDVDDDRFRNASVAFGPDGEVADRYDKVHRVPFGEYIPARAFFSRLADVSAVPRDAIAGTGPGVVDTPAGRFGVLISYEVFFQDRSRDAVRAGGRLLLVPTNASSYRDAQVPAQQLAVARLRAFETGRWVLQAAPTGYSAVVDHRGRVLARSGLGGAAVLRHDVQVRTGSTLFVRLGPAPVLVAAGVTLVVAHWRRRQRGHPRGDAHTGPIPPVARVTSGLRLDSLRAAGRGPQLNDFTVHARMSGAQATVTVIGDLDAATAGVLREQLHSLIADGAHALVLDLRRVTFIESVALGVIIAAHKQLGSSDRTLCIVLEPGQNTIRKVFKVTGLDGVFPVHSTPEAAEEDCADDPPAA